AQESRPSEGKLCTSLVSVPMGFCCDAELEVRNDHFHLLSVSRPSMGRKWRQRLPIRIVEIAEPKVDVEPLATRCRDESLQVSRRCPRNFPRRGEVIERVRPIVFLEGNLLRAPLHDERDLVGVINVVSIHHSGRFRKILKRELRVSLAKSALV